MHSKMRVVLGQFQTFDGEVARFALQLGVSKIRMNTLALPGERIWTFGALKDPKERTESYDLKWTAIENVPLIFYDGVILGFPGKDEQIEDYCQTIWNTGKLGIPMLEHHFSSTFMRRITTQTPGRGGAGAIAFDERQLRPGDNALREKMARKRYLLDYDVLEAVSGMTADDLSDNYRYFMDAALPTAEKTGVILTLHPDDPSLRRLGGIQRMVTPLENHKRAMEVGNNPAWDVSLCLGCYSEKEGGDCALEMIHCLGVRKKIPSVRSRDVWSTSPCFQECSLGEGNYDSAGILYELGKVGYEGVIMENHVLKMDCDSGYGHHARLHEIGYIQEMIQMMDFACGEK